MCRRTDLNERQERCFSQRLPSWCLPPKARKEKVGATTEFDAEVDTAVAGQIALYGNEGDYINAQKQRNEECPALPNTPARPGTLRWYWHGYKQVITGSAISVSAMKAWRSPQGPRRSSGLRRLHREPDDGHVLFGWTARKIPAHYIAEANRLRLGTSGMEKIVTFDQSYSLDDLLPATEANNGRTSRRNGVVTFPGNIRKKAQ